MVRRLLVTPSLAFVALVLVVLAAAVGPAGATGSAGSTTSADGDLDAGCVVHPWTWSLTLDPGTVSWTAQAELDDPAGYLVDSDSFVGYGEGRDGSGAFVICDYAGPGRYRISMHVTTYDATGARDVVYLPDSTFAMRAHGSRTTLSASDTTPRLGQAVRLKVSSQVGGRGGRRAASGVRVRLQVLDGGHWHHVDGSRVVTSRLGRHVYAFRWDEDRAVVLRAVTVARDGVRQSVSAAVRLAEPAAVSSRPADEPGIRGALHLRR